MTSILTVDEFGNQFWKNELGQYHHDDDLPAFIYADGHQEWYQNGKLHRLDGPAFIRPDGYQSWWQNGKIHRMDGPAVIWKNGYQSWWQNDKRHRLDGPAIIFADGSVRWFVNGVHISKEDIAKWMENNSINPRWEDWTDAEIMSFALRFG